MRNTDGIAERNSIINPRPRVGLVEQHYSNSNYTYSKGLDNF